MQAMTVAQTRQVTSPRVVDGPVVQIAGRDVLPAQAAMPLFDATGALVGALPRA